MNTDKQLLLKDLCARLPYNVICCNTSLGCNTTLSCHLLEQIITNGNIYIKPYLRPMSSMTEEEKEQMRDLWIGADTKTHATRLIDFYNKQHFDYRGLIEKGLALEAPDGMYNF